jgi:hypothetical protein
MMLATVWDTQNIGIKMALSFLKCLFVMSTWKKKYSNGLGDGHNMNL